MVGCGQGWMRPRWLQGASVSAVPMQRRAGEPPIRACTCMLLAARSQWRLLTRWVLSSTAAAGLLRLVRSNELTARPPPSSHAPRLPRLPRPAAPPGRVPLPRLGRKDSQRRAGTMHIACMRSQDAKSGDLGPWEKAVMAD